MTARAYYNELDPYAAEWLRNLIAAGHIAPGDVDERDIRDVRPDDLAGYTQCHFFAGIGVWSHALRRAEWRDDLPVWTGSCPCQPFSAAGGRGGFDDERHLWPAFHHLIAQRRPLVVLGEQVASKDGLAWLDLVQVDMEGSGYAVAPLDICAAGFGAPHIRQRLWFVGVADASRARAGRDARGASGTETSGSGPRHSDGMHSGHSSVVGGAIGSLADTASSRGGTGFCDNRSTGQRRPLVADDSAIGNLADALPAGRAKGRPGAGNRPTAGSGSVVGVADTFSRGQQGACGSSSAQDQRAPKRGLPSDGQPGPVNGDWRDADWLLCRDGKWRPVEPGTFPLAHGVAARVGRLRAYGNAIVAPVAQGFIEAAAFATGMDLV